MPLATGQTLTHYEILGPLGAGGMGEVYRAKDTRLEREVAIKVLPDELAGDDERLRRFEREAKTLASLNHTNLAHVYGIDQEGDTCFIAMELVPGDDLAAKLARGPLPVDEAVDVCRQIAEGLEAAHEAGVIHRDLKPANVRITPEGVVKILDFGLAKAVHPRAGKDGTTVAESDSFLMTQEGVVLGTPTYMSPEQARGKPVDRRTDVWAFGCVLYECLTGKRAFEGDTLSDVIAAVLGGEPDWSVLPAATPAHVRSLLSRCLVRDPRRRLRDVGEARVALEGRDQEERVAAPSGTWRGLVVVGLAGLVVGGFVRGKLWTWGAATGEVREAGETRHTRRSLLPLNGELHRVWKQGLALAPDGSALVHGDGSDPGGPLYLRRLDALESTPIPGTEGQSFPAFSPDGDWIVAFDGDALVKTSLREGESVRLCDSAVPAGTAWCDDGWIYFVRDLWLPARIRAEGGKVEPFSFTAMHPSALPGDAGVLMTLIDPDAPSYRADSRSIVHVSRDGERRVLIEGGYSPSFVAPNHLAFMRNGGLYAVPFDLEHVEVTGPARSVVPGVCTETNWGWSDYTVARDGTLVYTPGPDLARAVPTWVDRETEEEEPLALPAAVYNSLDLARDGSRLAIQVCESLDQVRVLELRRGTSSRLTLEGRNAAPVFGPDGEVVYYGSQRSGRFRIYRQRADGSTPAERVLTDAESDRMDAVYVFPRSVSPDGEFLVVDIVTREMQTDVWGVPLDGSGPPEPLLDSEDSEYIASLSPDGRWLLFNSTRSGQEQIYVRPFPDLARREWQIASGQGYHASWTPDGKEILYRFENRFYSVSFRTEPDFEPDAPREIFEVEAVEAEGPSFRASTDGKRLLLYRPVGSREDAREVVLVTDWDVELERLVPTGP